nr:hypothetical protein [Clostridioides sp.]
MKFTEKLGLKKPDPTDFYNLEDFNYNADKIDEELGNLDPVKLLNQIKTIDGEGSGLDADLLDGKHSTAFATSDHKHDMLDINNLNLTAENTTVKDTDNNFESGTVEGALKELATKDKALDKRIDDNKTEVDKEIADLKQSVSSGKQLIATAITGKDTPTSGSDSFETMAGNADLLRSKLADTIAVKGIEATGSESFDNLRDKVNNIVAIIGCSSGDSSVIESIDLNKSSGSSEVYLDELTHTPYSGSYRINGFVRSNNGRISYFRVEHIRDGKIILNKSVEYQDSYKSGVTVSVDISDVVKGDSIKTYLKNGYPSGQTETCYKIYLSCDLIFG